jgi:hypothetical protein
MLRKEIAGGFLVAGFLAAPVSAGAWQDLFLTGHGFVSSVENAPSVRSSPCSVSSARSATFHSPPLSGRGGMSFGGVAGFLSADLITLPLLLIYRKYYGGRLTLRLLATFWLVMSSAGLATGYLFQALGAIPTTRPHPDRHSRPGLEPHHRA